MDKILEKWDEILQTVKTEHDVSDISFDTWIKPLEVFGVEGNTLYILVPSEQMTLSYISKKYYLPLKVAIAEIIGTEYEIQFILPEQTRNIRPSNNKGKKTPEPEASKRSNLNPNYTFDTFVVGSNNRFAQSASLAVAESPGEASWNVWKNPLDAFHWTFHPGKKSGSKSFVCYFRGIYQ